MQQFLLVFIGGGIGALSRWQIASLIITRSPDWRFPIATFVVNMLGCLIAGIFAGWMIKNQTFNQDLRLFLFTGLLGGFTTFSAFGIETVELIRRQEYAVAIAYILASLLCGIAGIALMLWLTARAQ